MLLRVGQSPVSALSKRLNLKRVTTYAVLDSLRKKGYVNYITQGKCRIYIPNEPFCLVEEVERKSQNLKHQLTLARECATQLQAFPRSSFHQAKTTQVFYGKEAQERLFHELSTSEPLDIISVSDPREGLLSMVIKSLENASSLVRVCHLELGSSKALDLFIQGEKVMCLNSNRGLELTIQNDPIYSKLLRHLFHEAKLTTIRI